MSDKSEQGYPQTLGLPGEEMRTPDEVSAMVKLKAVGWGTKRIAAELACSRNTVQRWLRLGSWRPVSSPSRSKALDGLDAWLAAVRGTEQAFSAQGLGRDHAQTVPAEAGSGRQPPTAVPPLGCST